MEQKYKCLKVFEWVYGINIHVLGKELFCTQLFAIAAKFPNLVYSERCSHNLSREQYHSSLCLFMPLLTDKWTKPKTWPHVCLPISWWWKLGKKWGYGGRGRKRVCQEWWRGVVEGETGGGGGGKLGKWRPQWHLLEEKAKIFKIVIVTICSGWTLHVKFLSVSWNLIQRKRLENLVQKSQKQCEAEKNQDRNGPS